MVLFSAPRAFRRIYIQTVLKGIISLFRIVPSIRSTKMVHYFWFYFWNPEHKFLFLRHIFIKRFLKIHMSQFWIKSTITLVLTRWFKGNQCCLYFRNICLQLPQKSIESVDIKDFFSDRVEKSTCKAMVVFCHRLLIFFNHNIKVSSLCIMFF